MGKRHISAYRGAGLNPNRVTKKKPADRVSAYVTDEKKRGGLLEGTGYVAGRLGLGLAGVGEGIGDIVVAGGDLLRGDTEMAKYRFLDNRTAEAQQSLTDWYNPGKGMQFAGDVASGIGQSSVFLLDALVPGLGTGLFFGGITGQSVAGAAQQTGDVGWKEIGYGVASGAAEAALGKLIGAGGKVAGKLGSSLTRSTGKAIGQRGITTALTKATGKKMAGMGWNVAKNTLADAAGEFNEEFAAEYIDTGLQILFGIDPNASTSFGEAFRAGAVGLVSGAAMGAPANVYNYKNSAAAGKAIREEGGVDQLLYRAAATVDVLKEQEEQAREKGRTKAMVPEEAGLVGKTAAKGKQAVANLGTKIKASKTKGYWEKLEKNINAYTSMDESMRNSNVGDAILGELRGNLFFTNMSYAVEEAEETLKTATDKEIAEWLVEINEKAKKAGNAEANYSVEDFRSNKDGILSTVAAAFWIDEMRRTAAKGKTNEKTDAKAEKTAQEASDDPWAGIADGEDTSGFGASGEAEEALLRAAVNESVPKGSVPEMLAQFRKGTKLTPAEFASAWSDGAHIFGRYGLTADETADTPYSRMEPEAREAAVKFGRETEEAERKASEEKAKAKKKPAEQAGKKGTVVRGEGLDIRSLSDEQYAAYKGAEVLAEVLGTDIVIETAITDKAGRTVNGYYDTKTNRLHVNINALRNGKNISLYTLGHEVAHYIKEWSPAKFEALADFVLEQMGVDAETAMAEKLVSLRRLGIVTDTMTVAEANALAREELVAEGMELVLTDGKVLEELAKTDKSLWEKIKDWITDVIAKIKKYYGELNQASKTAQVLKETVDSLDEIERLFTEGVREAGERTRTAGVETVTRMNEGNMHDSEKKMSIRAEYSQEIEEWHRDGRPDGESFVLGMTGDVLQGLGAIESDIYINGDKIKEILKDHPEMTLEEIKKIPQILEDPVLILKSRNVGRGGQMNSRMVIFGAVKAETGQPVMSVLDLHPTENNFTISDMQKVTSAYTKTTSPVQFVKDSFIVYADKKRTASLLRSIGFQMPIELNKSGYIGSISYKGRSVNIFGEKFYNVFVEGQRKYSIEETDDTAYLAAVERGDMVTAQKMVDEAAKDAGYKIKAYHGTNAEFTTFEYGHIGESSGVGILGDGFYFTDEKELSKQYGKRTIDCYIRIGNPYMATTDDLYNLNTHTLENQGYDGVILKVPKGTIYMTFESEQIKSADPVTYDDNGNVIPLSERFKEDDSDIRYSIDETPETPDVSDSAFDAAVKRSGLSARMPDKEARKMVEEADKRARAAERKAERSAKSEQAARAWAKETVRKTRAQRDEAVYRARRDATDYKRAVYRTAYAKAEEKNRAYREQTDRKAEEARERKEMTARKRTIMQVLGGLQTKIMHPTKTNHVPKELHDLVQTVMRTADPKAWDQNRKNIREMGDLAAAIEKLESKATRTAIEQERLDRMKTKYELLEAETMPLKQQAEALFTAYKQYNDTLPEDMQIPESVMDELSKRVDEIEDVPLKEMGLESLKAVETFVKALSYQIKNANELFVQKRGEQVSDWVNTASREAADSKPLKGLSPKSLEIKSMGDLREFLWRNMKPLTAFEAIGSPKLMELFHAVLDGEDVWINDVLEAREVIVKAKEKYGYDSWDLKTRREFTNGEGKVVRLTIGEMMSLYAYAKREQAMGHLRGGGFVLDAGATEITEKSKIRTERVMHLTERYTMTEEDMGKLAGMLTEEQKQYATEIQDYLTSLGEKGNEISRKLYGLDLFNEKYYFPMKVKSEYLESQTGKTGDPKIKNRGFSKETVPDAKNPLVLQDFMTIVSGHVNDMATYHAFVLPVEDLTRVLNYQPSNAKIDEDGNWTEDKERTEYSTLKAVIESKYGAQANAYIEQLIRDLNGGARREAATSLIDKGITAFKRASTMASLSVLIQQPTSIFRAMAYIDNKYFRSLAALDVKNHKQAWEQVKKYAKVAAIKEMGGYDTGVGARTADYLNSKEYKTWGEKAKAFFLPGVYGGDANYRAEIFGKGAAYADELAWIQMFDACKREQAEKLGKPMDSEEVLEAAGKRFTEVVRRTQVYDSTLTRSEYMRSKDTGVKMATAFMAEPTTVVSMMLDGFIRYNRGDKAFLRRTAGAVAASVIFNALLVSLIYAARDDDEEKTFAETYLATVATETAEGFNPLEYLPYTRDIMSLMKGYDIERTDMALFADLFRSLERITSSKRSMADKAGDIAGAVSSFFGIPTKNILRDVRIIPNIVQESMSGERTTGRGISSAISDEFSAITNLFGADNTNGNQMYNALRKGDEAHYERVAARYKTPQAAELALRDALRMNDRRIAEAAEARLAGELEAYESIVEQIEAEGVFDRNIVIRAINNELSEIKELAEEDDVEPDALAVIEAEEEENEPFYRVSDLTSAMERGDKGDTEAIMDILVTERMEQGRTEAQARAAVKSGVTSYWKKRYLAAWEENNSAEMKRILELLEETELYGEYNDVATMAQNWIKNS